jgi:hypothetical protein
LEILFNNFDVDGDDIISHDKELDPLLKDLKKGGMVITREQWIKQSSSNGTDLSTMVSIINNSIRSYQDQHSCCDHDHEHHHHHHVDMNIYKDHTFIRLLELFHLEPTGSVYHDMTRLVDAGDEVASTVQQDIINYFFDLYDQDKDGVLNIGEFTKVWNGFNNSKQTTEQVQEMLTTKYNTLHITRQQFHNLVASIMSQLTQRMYSGYL